MGIGGDSVSEDGDVSLDSIDGGDVTDGGEGGGVTPLAVADFENGLYTINSTPTTLGAVVQEDTNDWGSVFDTDDIIPGIGWVMEHNYGFAFAGGFLAAILAGCTVVVDFSADAAAAANIQSPSYLPFDIITNDFSISLTAFTQSNFSGVNDGPGGHSDNTLPAFVEGANKFAATFTDNKLAISLNGSPAVSINAPLWGAVEWADIYWFSPHVVGPPEYAAGVCTIRSITVYAPQADADLPQLST